MTTETETAAAVEPTGSKIAKPLSGKAKAKPTLKADALGTMRPAAKPAGKVSPVEKHSAAKPPRKAASKPAAVAGTEQPGKAPKPLSARALAEAAIAGGQVPNPPNFEAKTHARFRGKLADLVALVERGDVKRLKAYAINPISSSPRALAKYRDRAVIALEARAKAAKAKAG